MIDCLITEQEELVSNLSSLLCFILLRLVAEEIQTNFRPNIMNDLRIHFQKNTKKNVVVCLLNILP